MSRQSKDEERAEIERLLNEFLGNGGKITKYSTLNKAVEESGSWQKQRVTDYKLHENRARRPKK